MKANHRFEIPNANVWEIITDSPSQQGSSEQATGNPAGSPLTPQEGKTDTPKRRAERIQRLLIITMGISLPYGFHSIMNHEVHAPSEYIIIATIIMSLTLVLLIERQKNHRKLITP